MCVYIYIYIYIHTHTYTLLYSITARFSTENLCLFAGPWPSSCFRGVELSQSKEGTPESRPLRDPGRENLGTVEKLAVVYDNYFDLRNYVLHGRLHLGECHHHTPSLDHDAPLHKTFQGAGFLEISMLMGAIIGLPPLAPICSWGGPPQDRHLVTRTGKRDLDDL